MTNISIFILSTAISYLIGSLNFAMIFSLLLKKQDIRNYGSKNAGATNVVRIYGMPLGIIVFIGDFVKSIGAIFLCTYIFNIPNFQTYINLNVGLAVILGHLYPIFFKFRGGKGIATSAGIILTQDIRIFSIVVIIFLLALIFSKTISISSLCAAISYPIMIFLFQYFNNTYEITLIIFSIILTFLIFYSHRENIKRLKAGTEKKLNFSFTKK